MTAFLFFFKIMAKKLSSFEMHNLLIFHRQDLITYKKNTLLLHMTFYVLKAFLPLLLQLNIVAP